MLFSSPFFIWIYLPASLVVYFLTPKAYKNHTLLGISLIFYAWSDIEFILLLCGSILLNFWCGELLSRNFSSSYRRRILAAGITINLLLLVYFKYANFMLDNINHLSLLFNTERLDWTYIALPIGISFFTFQSISYLVECFRRPNHATGSLVNTGL